MLLYALILRQTCDKIKLRNRCLCNGDLINKLSSERDKTSRTHSQIEINIMVYERYKRPFISTMKEYVEREQYLMEFNCYIYLLGVFYNNIMYSDSNIIVVAAKYLKYIAHMHIDTKIN